MREPSYESDSIRLDWDTVAQSLARPYRVRVSMILLVSLIPFYILIPAFFPPATRHVPELALDRALPLVPYWALVYGALYLFLILLPVFVVREDDLIRRTVNAYRFVWVTAYIVFFVVYPTAAPRPARVVGEGFAFWGLRVLYAADPPYNCFPSLHVAHSFVSALAAGRVHRGVGTMATIGAAPAGCAIVPAGARPATASATAANVPRSGIAHLRRKPLRATAAAPKKTGRGMIHRPVFGQKP